MMLAQSDLLPRHGIAVSLAEIKTKTKKTTV